MCEVSARRSDVRYFFPFIILDTNFQCIIPNLDGGDGCSENLIMGTNVDLGTGRDESGGTDGPDQRGGGDGPDQRGGGDGPDQRGGGDGPDQRGGGDGPDQRGGGDGPDQRGGKDEYEGQMPVSEDGKPVEGEQTTQPNVKERSSSIEKPLEDHSKEDQITSANINM